MIRDLQQNKADKDKFGLLEKKVIDNIGKLEELAMLINQLQQILGELNKSDKKIEFAPVQANFDQESLSGLKSEVEALKSKMRELEKISLFKPEQKSSGIDAGSLEKMLMQRLQDFMNDINDRLGELQKLRARVAKLEKQMKKLKKLIASLGHLSPEHSPNRDEDDAMFTKKPLLGNSCASCDKDIINLIGRGADFYPW